MTTQRTPVRIYVVFAPSGNYAMRTRADAVRWATRWNGTWGRESTGAAHEETQAQRSDEMTIADVLRGLHERMLWRGELGDRLLEAADLLDECERHLVPLQEDYAYDGEPDPELAELLARLRGETKGER